MENTLGSRVKFLREQLHMKQADVGDFVGLHSTNVGRIENEKVYPTADVLLKLSKLFNVSCDWLLTGENANSHFDLCTDEYLLIENYRKLSNTDKEYINELIEFKIYKAQKEKSKETLSGLDKCNNIVS